MSDCCLPHDHGGVFEHHKEKMPPMESFERTADLFKKLDDPNRLKIFWLLCHCEECVINLSSLMDMSRGKRSTTKLPTPRKARRFMRLLST